MQRKRDIVASYFSIDGSESSHVFGEFQWDGNWISRRYAFADRADRRVPDFVSHPIQLFNAAASRCLTSAGPGRAPTLAACTDSSTQQWRWDPLTVYPGNTRNAALVSVATSQCIAERATAIWSPRLAIDGMWRKAGRRGTVGLVYTPLRHCLGENDGKLTMRGCTALTTRYRWATTQRTPGERLEARHRDGRRYCRLGRAVRGVCPAATRRAGIQRVWPLSLAKASAPALWYANAIPFDPQATAPSCAGDKLCFDSVRFLLGDFDGDGKADLMIVRGTPGRTAFWLLRSTGESFEAPRLWLQTSNAFRPELTQQYVAANFTGTGRASVLIAQKRPDSGLDLWLASSQAPGASTGSAPVLWAQARESAANVDLLARGTAGSRASLVAVDGADGRLALTPDHQRGHAHERRRTQRLAGEFLRRGFVKVTMGAVAWPADGNHADSADAASGRIERRSHDRRPPRST
ncbi:hypothetical protein ACFFYR_23605 [Paraburkholderia dipogonis]|uniref:hypothetical protein n=1 Tax=Paraburkholderia dipogonis TaxID=1211383 RepID=UPI0035E48B00